MSKHYPPHPCALDTQQPATHPPTGQCLGCVWVLVLTLSPRGFKRPHWLEAGLRPASSENLAAMFLRIQPDIGAESLPGSQNCTNCYCLAPVRPATNARNRQKSKPQQKMPQKIIGAESLPFWATKSARSLQIELISNDFVVSYSYPRKMFPMPRNGIKNALRQIPRMPSFPPTTCSWKSNSNTPNRNSSLLGALIPSR